MSSKIRTMQRALRKYGNSTVLALPPVVLRELGLEAGQIVTLHYSAAGGLVLLPQTAPVLDESAGTIHIQGGITQPPTAAAPSALQDDSAHS